MSDPEASPQTGQGRARSRMRGLPIAVQIGVLLMVSLIAAQLISVLVVLASPPPRPSIFSINEVAGALRGGQLDLRPGPPLVRVTTAEPPRPFPPHATADPNSLRALAMVLGARPEHVRFVRIGQPLVGHIELHSMAGREPGPPGAPPIGLGDTVRWDGPAVHFVLRRADARGRGPPGPPLPAGAPGVPGVMGIAPFPGASPGESIVIGGFVAAMQAPDGRWTQVRTPMEPFLTAWHWRIVLWLLGCILVVAPTAWLFARRITAPIDRFAAAAAALGRDPRAPPMDVAGPAEIGKAAAAFNDMQARLRRYVEDRTAMVGAISHDLRTPLARLRYKIDSAPEPLKAQVLSDVDRMEAMIGSVLAFIREASEPGRRERLDLRSIVECVTDEAGLAGGDASCEDGPPVTIDGDALALQRMLTNLVDNAIKYGRRANLRLRPSDGEAVVEIRDEGPGLPGHELARVFQPFYRPNAARTLDDGGVGLGLAVARSIARAHGGDVELRNAEGGGLLASVRLPLAT